VGATKAEYFTEIRKVVPDSFFVGTWREHREEVFRCKYGMNANGIADKFITRNHISSGK
jgi:orotidine-5'-phosphate decarboxylase